MSNSEINTEQLKKEIKEELLKREIIMGLQEDEIDLFELFAVLKKYWKIIVIFPIIVAILVAVYAKYFMPNYYKASGTIFVHSSSGGGALASLMSNIPMASLMGLGGGGGGTNYMIVYLKSNTMNNYIINRFGIATNPAIVGEDYQPDPEKPIIYDSLLSKMEKIVTVENDPKTGLITISAETMSATTSAEIVTAYIEKLNELSKGPQQEKRIFIEKQLEKIGKELETSENEFKEFQDKHKLFALDKQTAAAIDRMTQLESQRINSSISLEMQQSMLKSSGSVPELVKVEAQKVAEEAKSEAIRKEISEVEKELSNLPDVSLEFIRLQRNLKVKEKLYAILTEQHEMAKITEAEERSQFEVIDQARIPQLISKPKRKLIILLSGFSSGVLVVFLAFLIEFIKRRKEQEKKEENKAIA